MEKVNTEDLDAHRRMATERPQCRHRYASYYGSIAKQHAASAEAYTKAAQEALEVQAVYLEAIGETDDE